MYYFNTVEDMKAADLQVGDTCQTLGYYSVNDGGAGLYKIVNDDTLVDDGGSIHDLENGLKAELIEETREISAKKFGCIDNGITDSTNRLNSAINFCYNNQKTLIIDGIFRVTESINTKGVKLKGASSNNPRGTRTYTSSKYGYIGFDYLKNVNNGALITFEDYINDVVTFGNGIVSENASPILYCNSSSSKKLDLDSIFVCGFLRTANQIGIQEVIDDNTLTYINGYNNFQNLNVFNCGGDGIKISSIESQNWKNLKINYNGGNGLSIYSDTTKDCPIDYTSIQDSDFSCNGKHCVNLYHSFRKNLSFINCKASEPGMYSIRGETPQNIVTAYAGWYVYGNNPKPYDTLPQDTLIFDNCSGEYVDKLIHIETTGTSENTILNNLVIKNCTSYKYNSSDSCLAYIDINYCKTISLHDNYTTANKFYLIGDKSKNGTLIPLLTDDKFNEEYGDYLVPTLSVSTKITVSNNNIYRRGDIVKFYISGKANENISAFETLVNNFPIPLNIEIIPIVIANTLYRGSIYTNRTMTSSQAIQNNQDVIISGTYIVKHLSNKNGN